MRRRPAKGTPIADILDAKSRWIDEHISAVARLNDHMMQGVSPFDRDETYQRHRVAQVFLQSLGSMISLRFYHLGVDEKAFQVMMYTMYLGLDPDKFTPEQRRLQTQAEKEIWGNRKMDETLSPSQILTIIETFLDAIERDFDECFSPQAPGHNWPVEKTMTVYRSAMKDAVRAFREFTAGLRRDYAGNELAAALRDVAQRLTKNNEKSPAVRTALNLQPMKRGV